MGCSHSKAGGSRHNANRDKKYRLKNIEKDKKEIFEDCNHSKRKRVGIVDLSCFALMPVLTYTRNSIIREAQIIKTDTTSPSRPDKITNYALKSISKFHVLKDHFGGFVVF